MTVEYQKVWRTMNDLEMVTSKICSAREIIDNAIDKIQAHQNDKAEMLMNAAYEFLEYYLQEFDDKFKLAWQATVGDLRDGDKTAYDAATKEREYYEGKENNKSWDSFWESYYPEEYGLQYTDEEISAMCDAAEKKHSEHYYDYTRNDLNRPNPFDKKEGKTLNYDEAIAAGWSMTDDGFWIKEQKPKKETVQTRWILPVQEAKDCDTDETEYFVCFPQDLLDAADLKEGDAMHWIDNNDGSYTIRKPLGPDEC